MGERQLVFVAIALAQAAPILVLDEPTAHLDIRHQVEVMELLVDLNEREGRTIIAVLHDLALAANFFPRVTLMSAGRIVADGAPATNATDEGVRQEGWERASSWAAGTVVVVLDVDVVDVDVDVDVVAVEPVVIAGRSGTTTASPSSGFVAAGMRGGRLDSRDCPATMPTVNHPSVVQAIAAASHSARSAIGRRIGSAPAYRSCIVAILLRPAWCARGRRTWVPPD